MKRWWGAAWLQSQPVGDLGAGVLSLLVGALLGGGFWMDEMEALGQLRSQAASLAHLQPQAPKPPPPQGTSGQRGAASGGSTGAAHGLVLPELARSDSAWPWLQQRMQVHRLELLSMRPGPLETQTGWPTQTLTLDVQGRWQDWLDFERQLHRHAPWWTVTQWQITPLAQGSDRVRVQWQGRLAWQPANAAGPAQDWPQWVPRAGPQDLQDQAVPLFAVQPALPQGQSVPATVVAGPGVQPDPTAEAVREMSPDPSQWTVQALRFYGTWRQAGRTHAVLGHGPYQQVLALGQRVGRDGHRLARIGEDGVLLQPADAAQTPIHLSWSGGQR